VPNDRFPAGGQWVYGRLTKRTCLCCGERLYNPAGHWLKKPACWWGLQEHMRAAVARGSRRYRLFRCPGCGREFLHWAFWRRSVKCIDCRKATGRAAVARCNALRQPVRHEERPCRGCGAAFRPERTTARFCSPRCRVAWNRRKKAGTAV